MKPPRLLSSYCALIPCRIPYIFHFKQQVSGTDHLNLLPQKFNINLSYPMMNIAKGADLHETSKSNHLLAVHWLCSSPRVEVYFRACPAICWTPRNRNIPSELPGKVCLTKLDCEWSYKKYEETEKYWRCMTMQNTNHFNNYTLTPHSKLCQYHSVCPRRKCS